MKKLLVGLMAGAMVLVGCSSNSGSDTQKLVVSTWGLNADIVQKDVYEPFEKENNCEIVVEEGGTSDRTQNLLIIQILMLILLSYLRQKHKKDMQLIYLKN